VIILLDRPAVWFVGQVRGLPPCLYDKPMTIDTGIEHAAARRATAIFADAAAPGPKRGRNLP
jgi:hypothetical protein